MNSIYRVTDRPFRCSLMAPSSSDPGPADRRDPPVQRREDPAPPARLIADEDSILRARRSQREQRARALELFYQSWGDEAFDRPFLEWSLEDPELVMELRGRARVRGAVLLSKTRRGER